MRNVIRGLSILGIFALLLVPSTANATTLDTVVMDDGRILRDCHPSFADEYLGYHVHDDVYNVKITYVDVNRFFLGESGTIDIHDGHGHVWENFNGSPSGGTIPIDFRKAQRGAWTAELFHANGRSVCAQRFKVSVVIDGYES